MKRKISFIVFIFILLVLIVIFGYVKLKSYTYSTIYNINNYHIEESYNSDTYEYTFYITIDDITYPYLITSNYIKNKKLISEIEYYSSEDEVCILPVSSYIDFYPLCSNSEEVYSYNLSSIEIPSFSYKDKEYLDDIIDNIEINYLDNKNYLLYNYKGYIYVNNNTKSYITLFTNDVYTINLIYQMDNYVILADYNDSYYFNKLYVIDMSDGSYKEIEFAYDISFESYFLGDYDNKVYLLDKKEEKEYVVNLKKLSIEEIEFTILNDGNLETTTYNKIINTYKYFDNNIEFNYKIIDDTLYYEVSDYIVKISDKKVASIINVRDDTVYYLESDSLYLYNNEYGEVLLMSYFEWNFNNTNMIYISS